MVTKTAIILPNCKLCNHIKSFEIQKCLDTHSMTHDEIEDMYGISTGVIANHNKAKHRNQLISFGWADYIARKKGIDAGNILADYIGKWADTLDTREGASIKDSDVLKAISEFNKLQGSIVEKHEITLKRDLGKAIKDYLEEDDEEEDDEI